MNLNMNGLKAIVTGGSRGIGKSIVENFIAEEMKVATCARGQSSLETAKDAWKDAKHEVYAMPLDVTDKQQIEDWFANTVAHLGGLDVLVSNVSTLSVGDDVDKWRARIEVDLLQHVRLTELALPHLKKSNAASIIYIASIASVMNNVMPTELEYGSIKAALTSYAMKMANILGPHGIRVNVVSPGPVHHEGGFWDMVKHKQPDFYERVASLSVFNRLGTSQEIADVVTFLSSPAASLVTATNLRVDGGTVKTTNF
jgi:NAD(P)-dependent dehydrogenase (short-subunit alcohol dehydrogenase family)